MNAPTPLNRFIFRLAFMLVGVAVTVISSTLQQLTDYFNIPLENGGFFTAAFFIGSSFSILAGGNLLDRVMSRNISLAGMLFVGISLIALSFSQVAFIGLACILFFGVGYGFLVMAGNGLAHRYNPENPARELSVINFLFGLGAVMGPQIANFAISQPMEDSFRLMYWIVGGAALIMAGLTMLLPNFAPVPRSASSVKIAWVSLIPFAVMLFMYVGIEMGFSAWIKPQMMLVALSSASTGALGISIFWAGLTVGRFITTLLAGRVSGELLLFTGIGFAVFGVGGVLLFPATEGILLIMSFMVGFGSAPIFPMAIAILNGRYPEGFGTISGIIIATGNSGAIFIPAIQGQVGGGNNGGMIVLMVAALSTLVCAIIALRKPKSAEKAQPLAQ
ncbi:MAG: MFS transporter [bacterium]|nr:MFS transporter [bacterium]